MSEMMAIDDRGGLGLAGLLATAPDTTHRGGRTAAVFGPAPRYVAAICTVDEAMDAIVKRAALPVRDRFAILAGSNLPSAGQPASVSLPAPGAPAQDSEL